MAKVDPIMCTLEYSRKGLRLQGGTWVEDRERQLSLPSAPKGFVPMRDVYGKIANTATKLNELQQKSGYWDFCFHPEPAKESHV